MSRRIGTLLLALCAALASVFVLAPNAAAAGRLVSAPNAAVASRHTSSPQQYYLSLGDSLGYGYQAVKLKDATDPAAFDTGYTDDFASILRFFRPGIAVENLSCPGETSSTMVVGPCPWPEVYLHDPHTGAQLPAAVAFLQEHQGDVPVITLSIGANDVLPVTQTCLGASSCPALGPDLATLHTNLVTILRALRQAAPRATLIVLTPYNPFAVAYPSSNALAVALNLTIGAAALANHARVADAFVPFNVFRRPGLCALSYYCSNGDIHPTDAGYRVIAGAIFGAWLF